MTIGQRIRELRRETGLNQGEFALTLSKRTGVPVLNTSLSMYEKDDRIPPVETLQAIADYCGVSVDWLLGRSTVRNPDQELAAANYPADVHEMAQKLSVLPNGLRREVIDHAMAVIDALADVHSKQVEHLHNLLVRRGGLQAWEAEHKIKIVDSLLPR